MIKAPPDRGGLGRGHFGGGGQGGQGGGHRGRDRLDCGGHQGHGRGGFGD